MKIYFINPPFKAEYGKFTRESRSACVGRSGVLYYPLWLIYAAAVCKEKGFDIEFLDAPATQLNWDDSLDIISSKANDVGLFVLDTSTPSIENDIRFGEELKSRYPDAKIILVGTHPSAVPKETMEFGKKIDYVAKGEFDYIIWHLADALANGKDVLDVKGLYVRKTDSIVFTGEADHIENLDDIPFASKFIKEHLDEKNYFFAAAAYPEIQIFTGRGCPARCYFCVYPQTMHGHKYRLRSPQNVVDEMIYIRDNFPDVKEIVIEDDTFTANKQRVKDICELMIDNGLHRRFRWICNARVNLDCETMCLMKKAGCHLIIPGIESADQIILKNIKKGITTEQIEKYVKNAKKAGLLIHACYMVGNMGETKETMEKTLQMALRLKTDTAQFYPLQPYPGTEAYYWAKENGYLTINSYSDYCQEDGNLNCVMNLPEISSQELVDFCQYARKKYYVRPWFIVHRVITGLKDKEDLKRSLKAFGRFKKFIFK